MNLTIYYIPDAPGYWKAVSFEYTYNSIHEQGHINRKICFPENDKDEIKTKLKDWASENDPLLSAHLQDATISFIDAG